MTKSVGWGIRDENLVVEGLKANVFSVSVYDYEKIVGYGRIIGDKTMFLYIQDVMVMPSYQNKKIGTTIVKELIKKTKEYKKESPTLRVYLGAEKGKEGFYKKFGFKTRNELGLGEGMAII